MNILLMAILLIASLTASVWISFLLMATENDWIIAAKNKVLSNLVSIDKLLIKDAQKANKLSEYRGLYAAVMKMFLGGTSINQINKLETQNAKLQAGNLKSLGVWIIPGYVIFRKFESIARGEMHKTILTINTELYGKSRAEIKTIGLMAKMLSYPLIGVTLSLAIGAATIGAGNDTGGMVFLGLGPVLVFVLVYALYDDIRDKANKRREAIARQFPNVVSKLALLVTSGMIMDKAWNETAHSQDLELYIEMQKTSDELNSLISPEVAYGNFISRCSTKETAKLASAILQNLSKGNAEIGRLLKDMAKEAWQERKHNAKRDAERANAKLMIPSMLLLVSIMIMIMVPIAMNFNF